MVYIHFIFLSFLRQSPYFSNLSLILGNSHFVVKNSEEEPSEKYWLSLLRIWLRTLQQKLDQAVADGLVNFRNLEI